MKDKEFNLSNARKEIRDFLEKEAEIKSIGLVDVILTMVETQDKEFIKRDYNLIKDMMMAKLTYKELMQKRANLIGDKLV